MNEEDITRVKQLRNQNIVAPRMDHESGQFNLIAPR